MLRQNYPLVECFERVVARAFSAAVQLSPGYKDETRFPRKFRTLPRCGSKADSTVDFRVFCVFRGLISKSTILPNGRLAEKVGLSRLPQNAASKKPFKFNYGGCVRRFAFPGYLITRIPYSAK